MNKFKLINAVTISNLNGLDKPLMIELIMRSDDKGVCWPSVERLCKARGIKHEKNFKGADVYLPGLVTKTKRGRKNIYQLNVNAILALGSNEVTIKHTPATEGVFTPATADNTPALADNTPAAEGANSTYNITRDTPKESSVTPTAFKHLFRIKKIGDSPLPKRNVPPVYVFSLKDRTAAHTPATEGVSPHRWGRERIAAEERYRQVLSDSGADPDGRWED